MKLDHQPLCRYAGILHEICDEFPSGHPVRVRLEHVASRLLKINVVEVDWDDYLAWGRRQSLKVVKGEVCDIR